MDDKIQADYCTLRSPSVCAGCELADSLMCRFEVKDLARFLIAFLPLGIIVVIGMIRAGYAIYLLGWAAYWLFFFFIWEARVLCRHCPYWAEESRTLHCHANYGVIKVWKHDPRPMNTAEKFQFLIGALILMGYPFIFLLLGGEYLLAGVGIIGASAFVVYLKNRACTRCIHFSCPLNSVPKNIVDGYLLKNRIMLEAWEVDGYKMG